MISKVPGVPKDETPDLDPAKLANPPPKDPPKELPPNADLVEVAKVENALPVDVGRAALPAKEGSLLPLAAPKGELEPDLGPESPLNGDTTELAKPPNPDDLNLSLDVCGSDSALSEVFDA